MAQLVNQTLLLCVFRIVILGIVLVLVFFVGFVIIALITLFLAFLFVVLEFGDLVF